MHAFSLSPFPSFVVASNTPKSPLSHDLNTLRDMMPLQVLLSPKHPAHSTPLHRRRAHPKDGLAPCTTIIIVCAAVPVRRTAHARRARRTAVIRTTLIDAPRNSSRPIRRHGRRRRR